MSQSPELNDGRHLWTTPLKYIVYGTLYIFYASLISPFHSLMAHTFV